MRAAIAFLILTPLIALRSPLHGPRTKERALRMQLQTPGPRLGHSMVYDQRSNGVVLVDGVWPDTAQPNSRVWRWDGQSWQALRGAGPPATAMGAAVVDSRRQQLITYGGRTNGRAVNTLSEWNGAGSHSAADTTPGARFHHAMAYDSARGRTVMYGGATPARWDTDTWEWNGSSWMKLSVPGPGQRAAFRMVYDSHRRVVVLFGGIGPPRADGQPQEYLNDTWLWDGSTWRRASVEGPAGRRDYSMAFDSRRGIVLLYGGAAGSGPTTQRFADLWEWNGTVWKQVPQRTPTPGHRYVSAMAYDAARDRTVLYGGYSCANENRQCDVFGDTWEWDGVQWTRRQ